MDSLTTLLGLTGWKTTTWRLWAGVPKLMQTDQTVCFALADLRLQIVDLSKRGPYNAYGVWVHTLRSADIPYFAVVGSAADAIKVIDAYTRHSRLLHAA
jgi:hypothetical protein